MRLGVLDIGSNTGHLLVVDAHGGAAPLPASSHKQPLRLAEHLDEDGAVSKRIAPDTTVLPYPFHTGDELLAQCERNNVSIAGIMRRNEAA